MAQFKKAAWLTAGQKPDINPSSWAYLKLTEQRVNAKKNVIRWCFIDPGLSCTITVQFCCFRIYCTCLLKQSWTAANVVAGSSFQSGEERGESWVINNMSSVLLLQWSVAFHTWSSQWLSLQVFRSLLMWRSFLKLSILSPYLGRETAKETLVFEAIIFLMGKRSDNNGDCISARLLSIPHPPPPTHTP